NAVGWWGESLARFAFCFAGTYGGMDFRIQVAASDRVRRIHHHTGRRALRRRRGRASALSRRVSVKVEQRENPDRIFATIAIPDGEWLRSFNRNDNLSPGGIERPDSTNAMSTFWSLDLSQPGAQWRTLEFWPGPARMLSVVGVYNGDFFLFSGVSLRGDIAGKPLRQYLKDAYRFTRGKGWRRLSDLPRAAAAAPSPAVALGEQLLVVSGDDGEKV